MWLVVWVPIGSAKWGLTYQAEDEASAERLGKVWQRLRGRQDFKKDQAS